MTPKFKTVTTINHNVSYDTTYSIRVWRSAATLDEARQIVGPPCPASALPPITLCPQRHSQTTVSLNSNTPHYFTPPCLSLLPPPEHTMFSRNGAPYSMMERCSWNRAVPWYSPQPTSSPSSTWLSPNHPLRHSSNFLSQEHCASKLPWRFLKPAFI